MQNGPFFNTDKTLVIGTQFAHLDIDVIKILDGSTGYINVEKREREREGGGTFHAQNI